MTRSEENVLRVCSHGVDMSEHCDDCHVEYCGIEEGDLDEPSYDERSERQGDLIEMFRREM